MKKLALSLALSFVGFIASAANYRYSTDGGASWTDADTLRAACNGINTADGIVEVCADNDAMFGKNENMTVKGNIEVRSKADEPGAPFTITRDAIGNQLNISTGKELILSNVIFKSNGGTDRFFYVKPGTLRLRTGAKITSDPDGNANTKAALYASSNNKIYFEGGVLDGWKVSGEAPIWLSSSGELYIASGGVENCVNNSEVNQPADSSAIAGNGSIKFEMSGGFVRNNTNLTVNTGNPATIALAGGGTATITGGVITGNTFSRSSGCALHLNSAAVLNVSGTPFIQGNTYNGEEHNIYVNSTSAIHQTGDLLEGAHVGVSAANSSATLACGATFGSTTGGLLGVEYIFNDKAGVSAAASGTDLVWPMGARYSTDGGETWMEVSDAKAALTAVKDGYDGAIIEARVDCEIINGSVTPNCDLILRSWEGCGRRVTLKQGGQWVNWNVRESTTLVLTNIVFQGGAQENNGLFNVNAGATMRLEADSAVTSIAATTRAGIKVSGNLIINGGVVSGWNLDQSAPIAYSAKTGRIYLYAGGVENCSNTSASSMTATAIGSGSEGFKDIEVPVFTMTGGFIRNNHCSNSESTAYHGALNFREDAIIEISGGEITGNTGDSEYACGVTIGQRGTLNISGNPVISGNTTASHAANNVCLAQSSGTFTMVQTDDLTTGANIGVYSQNNIEGATFATMDTAGYTGAGYIHNDRNASLSGEADGTNLKWVLSGERPKYTVTFDAAGGSPTPDPQEIEQGSLASVPTEPTKTDCVFDGWYNGGNAWDFATDTVQSDITLTAHWKLPPPPVSWTGGALPDNESAIRTDGTLVYAYARGVNNQTNQVNGVDFITFGDEGDFRAKQSNVVVSPSFTNWDFGFGNEGLDNNYGTLLANGFKTVSGDFENTTYTLNGLVPGRRYLVQLIMHHSNQGTVTATAGGVTITAGGTGWTYGGTLVGTFTANTASAEFTVNYTTRATFNGIQVREIPAANGLIIIVR